MAANEVTEDIKSVGTSVKAYLEEVQQDADKAVERLESFTNKNLTWVDFPYQEGFDPGVVEQIDPSTFAKLGKASMNLDLSLFDPDRYKSHTYVSEFFDFLEPKLTEFINTGGTGIDDAVQDAIFENHRERKRRTRDDELLAATANVAKRGFPLPTDMVQAARAVVYTRFADEDYNTSRELTALIAERAQQNVQHAIDAGIRMESIQSEFTRFFHQAYTEYARQILEKYKVEQDVFIQQFRGDIDLINTRMKGDEINASLSQTHITQQMEQRRVESQQAIEKTKALIAQAEEAYRLQLQASESLTEFYRTTVVGVASQVNTISMASSTTSS